jgi:AAHS family 4-hydroxybenzoate transporter-like MFS transporter
MDGYDTQAIGYVAPTLANAFAIGRAALAPVFSASLAGLMIGALVLGPIADRVGRRRIVIGSTIAFGVCSLLTACVGDLRLLIAVRFLTGLGLGGAMPNTVALTAEYSPQRLRATLVMLMFCGFSLGAAVGGYIAAALIPQYGWRAVFIVGGVLPVALVPVLAVGLPESVRFLAGPRGNREAARLMLSRMACAEIPPDMVVAVHEDPSAGVGALVARGRAAATLLFWVVFFLSLLDLYLLSNWLPTVLVDAGASVPAAARLASLLQVGGIAGAVAISRVVDRFRFRALAVVYAGAAAAVAATGFAIHNHTLEALTILAAGFGIVGGQIAANALAAMHYPTALRSTGVGWALGAGRAGSIVGPIVGGVLLQRSEGPIQLFLLAAAPAAIAAGASLALHGLSRRER